MKKKILPIIFCAFILIFCLLTIVLPKSARSQNEKRVLATFPEFSLENIKDGSFMNDFDAYVSDHFALRDKWVGLYSYASLLVGRNGANDIYASKDGYLIPTPAKYDEEQLKNNLSKISTFIENCGLPSYLIIVPETGYIEDDLLPNNHKEYYDDKLFDTVKEYPINLIDLREAFKENKDKNNLYYKTDHHLTSFGALLMYNEYCDSLGIQKENFKKVETLNGFFGTSYSKSGLWLKEPDTIDIYEKENGSSDFTITIDDESFGSLLFREKLETEDKYEVFLNGNHGLTVINNTSLSVANEGQERHLLIVKDSFAHCFTTFLSESYEEIVLVDLRYYKFGVTKLLSEYEITDVLFLYGAENILTSTDFGWLNF